MPSGVSVRVRPGAPNNIALVAQPAEAGDSKSLCCQFESDQGYQRIQDVAQSGLER
jgi:hypothetical protein